MVDAYQSGKITNYTANKKVLTSNDDYFVPAICVAWLIGVQYYDRVRKAEKEPKPHCHDLDQVPEDLENMTTFFENLQFDRIIKTENPDSIIMDDSFEEIRKILKDSHRDKTKPILLYVYYAGHGVLQHTTNIVLNEDDPEKRYYTLEQKLSALSKLNNNYISVVFDCCREEQPQTATRSIGDEDDKKNDSFQNLFILFGCPPLTGVPAKSTIVKSVIECVQQHLDSTGGVLELPAAFDMKFKKNFEK